MAGWGTTEMGLFPVGTEPCWTSGYQSVPCGGQGEPPTLEVRAEEGGGGPSPEDRDRCLAGLYARPLVCGTSGNNSFLSAPQGRLECKPQGAAPLRGTGRAGCQPPRLPSCCREWGGPPSPPEMRLSCPVRPKSPTGHPGNMALGRDVPNITATFLGDLPPLQGQAQAGFFHFYP